MSNKNNNLYEFGEFRFDGKKQRLWQNDKLILLSPKSSELLQCLLEREGEFVSKEEIFECVWSDTFVEDGVLTQNIYTLRKTLGTDAEGLPIIENKTRLGYRITVPVKVSANGIHRSKTNGDGMTPAIDETARTDEIKTPAPAKPRNSKKLAAGLIFGVVLLAVFGFLGYRFLRPRLTAFFRKPVENVKFQSLTNTGDIWHPALSPDGNFAVFIREKKMHLKDLASNKEIRLDIPNVTDFSLLQFSHDSNFIYFRPTLTLRKDASVLRVSRFGGETRIVAEKTWGGFDVSNDGKQIVFIRNLADQTKQILTLKSLETGEERELASIDFPEMFLFNAALAFSPDNQKIAVIMQNYTARRNSLFLIDAESGEKTEIKIPQLQQYEQVAWLPDGETLIASASEGGKFFHLWKIFPADGDAQRITNGLSAYTKISVSSDGKKILALQTAENSNIFVLNANNLDERKQITFGKSHFIGMEGTLRWAGDDKLIYVSHSEENLAANLWKINLNDNLPQPLTSNTGFHVDSPSVSSDGKFVYFTSNQNQFVNIWRIDADSGGNLTPITNGKDGFRMSPQISPDGKFLYYIFRNREGASLKRLNLEENREETLLDKGAANPVVALTLAPDGSRLMFYNWTNKIGEDDDKTNFQLAAVSVANPQEIKFFDLRINSRAIQITPDGKAFDYVSYAEDKTRILRQNFEGGEPQEIFALQKTRIFNFAWSKSRNQLAISQGQQNNDAVLLTDFDK